MQHQDSKKNKKKSFDWEKVEHSIKELWENGMSPRAISLQLEQDGNGVYPWTNINAFVGKFRKTESSQIRQKNLGTLTRAPQIFDGAFACVICFKLAARTMWNARFCVDCRQKYSDRQLNRFKVYGLHPDEFDRMVAAQGNLCKLCDRKFDHGNNTAGPNNPCIDHCHLTGKVRGILCMKCNWALHMVEIPGWTDRANGYLRQ